MDDFTSKNVELIPMVAKILGREILSYVLAIDAGSIEKLIREGGLISKKQSDALKQLDGIAQHARGVSGDTPRLGYAAQRTIEEITLRYGKALFSELRESCAGKRLKLPIKNDPVLDALILLCEIVYPYVLIPIKTLWEREIFVPNLYGLKEEDTFEDAVLNDEFIRILFHDDVAGNGKCGLRYDSIGVGGGVQSVAWSRTILENAALAMMLRCGSFEDFVEAACQQVLAVRAALQEKEVSVPAFALFVGTGLTVDQQIDLGGRYLYPVNRNCIDLFPVGARPSTSESDIIGFILEVSIEYRLTVFPEEPKREDQKWPVELTTQSLFEKVTNIELGVTLSGEGGGLVKARNTASIIINPTNNSGMMYKSDSGSQAEPRILNLEDLDRIRRWVDALDVVDTSHIRLALRRYLSATNERADNEDALIDAVIGLENLFGERTEIAFSVCNSVARLLGDTEEKKNEIFSSINKVYKARSKIVHGQKEYSPKELRDFRVEAVSFLAESLKCIFMQHQDLANMKGPVRSRKIALGNY
ncbi:hypothetical protein [uncultured Roseibium sp.]|uniref:hypothetical protein n=1 Tax=uncultured Roseibium sp. TaxID=1936171 RepID=UPI003217B212